MLACRQHMVDFQKSCIPQQLRVKDAPEGRELSRRCKYLRLIARHSPDRGIADFIISRSQIRAQLRDHYCLTVLKLHHRRHMKNMLVISGEDKRLVALNRAADGRSELVLLIARIETHKRRRGTAQRTIAQEIETAPVPLIRSRFGHHIHNRAPGSP